MGDIHSCRKNGTMVLPIWLFCENFDICPGGNDPWMGSPQRAHRYTYDTSVYMYHIIDIHAALTNWYYWIFIKYMMFIEYMISIEYSLIYLLNISYDWLSPPTRLAPHAPLAFSWKRRISALIWSLTSWVLLTCSISTFRAKSFLGPAHKAQPASTGAQLTTALAEQILTA